MRISDWSSDVCSSDLTEVQGHLRTVPFDELIAGAETLALHRHVGARVGNDPARIHEQIAVDEYPGRVDAEDHTRRNPRHSDHEFVGLDDEIALGAVVVLLEPRDLAVGVEAHDRKSTRLNYSH